MAKVSKRPVTRPTRAGVSVETRRASDGSHRFYARFTDAQGRRHVAPPPDGGKTWDDWGQAFAAACARQDEAQRLSYRSRDGEKMLFRDLVAHHYLPTIKDAAPNTRKNTASHLGNGTGVPVRKGHYAERAARSQLLFAFGKLPIGAIGPNEVQQWISQMAIDGYDFATMRAKRSLLKTILQVAVDQGWLTHNAVDRARLPRPVEQPDEDRVVTPEEWAQIRINLSGEGTLLMCDLALDCGLRYEEVTALRPVDVIDGDARNANHVWVRQAVTWAGREFTGLTEPWSIGPTKGKRFRKIAVSARVYDRLRLYIDTHQRAEHALIFDYALLRAEHAQKKERDPRPARFPKGRFVSPTTGRSGAHGRAHTYSLGCRCPYCRTAASEARFWSRRAKGIQPAAPWLEEGYLADRSEEIDPIKYHWFTRYVFGRAVRAAGLDWTPTFHDLRHGMVSWSYDAGASPAVVQRDAGHANVRTTQAYMHVVDRVVGDERLSAMKVMYDRVQVAGHAAATPPAAAVEGTQDVTSAGAASAPTPALEQLSAMVLSNSGLTAAEKAALLLELASQSASATDGPAAPAPLRAVEEQSG
jgi:integrase